MVFVDLALKKLTVQCVMPLIWTLLLALIYHVALLWPTSIMAAERFIRINHHGEPVTDSRLAATGEWPCVLDQKTGLIWEVKTRGPGLHFRNNTYSWFNPDSHANGGLAGYPRSTNCFAQPCNTENFIIKVNKTGWCNAHDWRLPTREELRSLVDYAHSKNTPMLDTTAFPNSTSQFYWSADPSAANPDEAWGIGFAFGFDYTYYKNHRVHVRLVRNKKLLASKETPE